MEGQQNFSLSVDTFLERHVNIEELFNLARLRVDNMAGILQDLDLVGSTTGLTIQKIKDWYGNYSVEGTFVWVTWWVVVALTIIGLIGIFWCLRKRFMKAKKDHRPLLKRFQDLFSSDTQPRYHEMQEHRDPDSDENEDFIANLTPDNMRVGPPVLAPFNMGDVARRARDEHARDKLPAEARVQDHRADVHGTNSLPQQVPLGAPCPVTNVKIYLVKLQFYIHFLG
jgi:hypothetical protein